ncbi:MAG: hypothetical protein ACRBHB_07440 [Arenicella sp.]
MRGAGGTPGGTGQFIIGLVMMCGGGYMLLNSIRFYAHYGFGRSLYNLSGFGITSGMIMIPFIFGVGMVFYDSRNWLGWLLTCGSLVALVFGVISQIQFTFRSMSAFDLIVIIVLTIGGLGLLLRSLKTQ